MKNLINLKLFLLVLICLNCRVLSQDASTTTDSTASTNNVARPLSENFVFPKNRKGGSLSTRIIGGVTASNHQFPFQVGLVVWIGEDAYFCGGSLISKTWVLTAAHCVDGIDSAEITLGAYDLSKTQTGQITMNSTTFIMHENWDEDTLQNDVALIQLPSKVTLNENISTISLVNGSETFEDQIGTVIGWGLTNTGSMSNVMKYVNTTVMSNAACADIDPYQTVIIPSHICTSGVGTVGSCNGDSGGPLIINQTQIGIVSFGYSDCTAGKPSVYVRITSYYDWITTYAVEDEDEEVDGEDDIFDGNENGNNGVRDSSSDISQILTVLAVVILTKY